MILLFSAWGTQSSFGQLELHPVKRVNKTGFSKTQTAVGRTKSTTPLVLPFWDDFSTTKGLYPDSARWSNSKTIWVNESMGMNAPTVKVATFDGLDSAGLAYNSSEILLTGFTDSLISQPIDLSVATVGASDTSTVYLSFFYQLQGNGEPPDEEDFLQVEFKNKDLQWEVYMTIESREDFDRTVFYDTIVKVKGARFFHEAFQFRFRSYGKQSGPYDTWNIDYVYLNEGRNINDTSFPDRAAASPLSQLFGRYRAIPLRHFNVNRPVDTVYFDVKNLSATIAPSINYNATAVFKNYVGNSATTSAQALVTNEGVKNVSGKMDPLERVRVKVNALPDTTLIDQSADSVYITIKTEVVSDDNTAILNTISNDTVSSTYTLSDYYAYDDGTAEYSVSLIEAGDSVAYEFEMVTPNPDTLIAFNVYFPPYAITASQTLHFYILHESETNPGQPGRRWITLSPKQLVSNGSYYTRMRFEPALLINEPKFYIGWRQPAGPKIFVGLDADNDTGDKMWVNTNSSTWNQNTTVHGSIMIRPIFGSGTVDVVDGVNEGEETLSFYPNPNNGGFYVNGKPDNLKIYNSTGIEISFDQQEQGDQTFIQLHQPSGVYLLRYIHAKKLQTKKIVISR